MNKILSTIDNFRQLADGWNGERSSRAPNERTASDAKVFTRTLFSNFSLLEPAVSPASDGEINLYWNTQSITLDLGFFGDGTYSYYAKLAEGPEFFGDDKMVNQILPDAILEKLKIS